MAEQLTARFRRRGAKDPLDRLDVVVGPDAIRQRVYQMEATSRAQLRGIDMPPYLMTDNPPEVDMLGSGVSSRWLYETSTLERPGKLREIVRFLAAGEVARLVPSAPFKLVIADEHSGLIVLTDDRAAIYSALLVGPSALLDGLIRMFEALWRSAVPLEAPSTDPGADHPTSEESVLLALLAVGLTDQAIARRLELDHRTVQKRVHLLMRRLGVDTRF